MIIKEIGLWKVIKYVFYTFFEIVFNLMLFSPLKIMLLRLMGASIGKNTIICKIRFLNLHHMGLRGLYIGSNCYLGDRVTLDLAEGIIIGNYVTIANGATILTHMKVGFSNHPLLPYFPTYSKITSISTGCFIGTNSILIGGIWVGRKVFVAAGSVVTKDIPDNVLIGGVPAKIIKFYEEGNELSQKQMKESNYWKYYKCTYCGQYFECLEEYKTHRRNCPIKKKEEGK